MRFELEQRFAGPIDRVQEALIDPGLLDRLAELPKLGRPTLLSQDDDGICVRRRVRYAFTGQLSSAVTAVIDPSRLTWVEDSIVDRRTRQTRFRILPDHYADRLHCDGVFELVEDGDAATVRVTTGEIRVRFPLVGSRVERAIVSGLAEHARLEEGVVDEWIATSEL